MNEIGLKLLSGLLIAGGLAVIGYGVSIDDGFTMLFGGVMCFIAMGWFRMAMKIGNLRAQSFDWYIETYPECFKKRKVTCFKYGDGRIRITKMMNGMMTNRHECVQCGTALYYSPEN